MTSSNESKRTERNLWQLLREAKEVNLNQIRLGTALGVATQTENKIERKAALANVRYFWRNAV